MSRARFGLLLVLLVLAVGAGSFVVVLAQLDEDPGAGDTGSTTPAAETTTDTAAPTELGTPTFVAIVSSERDEGTARAEADELAEDGYDSGVLRSDDHTSLEAGFWVSYVGPFPDVPAARAAQSQLAGDGYPAAYVRCVGTAEECT